MACKPTICKDCGGSFPACQIRDGLCPACRAKRDANKQTNNQEVKIVVKNQ